MAQRPLQVLFYITKNNPLYSLSELLRNFNYKPYNLGPISDIVSDPKHTPKLTHIEIEVSAHRHSLERPTQ